MGFWLQENSWKEAKQLIKNSKGVAIIPVGSVEQHGYHLPLGTDSYTAIGLAQDAAEQIEVLIAPPIWYGWAPHHMILSGTVSIRPKVLIDFLFDIIASLSIHGVTKFIIINGHRMVNIPWMQIAAEQAQRELGVVVKIFDPAYMGKEILPELDFGYLGHAEEIETSHMMHLHPKMVHLDLIKKDDPIIPEELYSVSPSYTGDTLCYVPSTPKEMKKIAEVSGGSVGEPSKSTAEKGRKLHEHLIKNLVRVIQILQQMEA